MNTYQYSAKDKNGQSIVGNIEGLTESEVAEVLHNKGLIILTIKQVQVKKKAFRAAKGRVKADDLAVFSRQLATLIDTGIPMVQSLSILSEQIDNAHLRSVVLVLRQDIEAGMNFCDALSKHPSIFSELFVSMARAGEASGMLDEILDRLATYLEKSAALNRKIRASLVYPTVVVSMAIIITAVLLLKVVPTFKSIFDILGGQLPLPTRILIGTSDFLRHFFWLFILIFMAVGFIFRKYVSTDKGRYNVDAQMLKIAVFGPLLRKVAVAKFSRTFSTLVKSGVPILNALEIVAKTSGNKVIEETVLSCRGAVRDGELISRPLQKSGVFPAMVCRMINIGEQTGQLEKMLSKIADFYDEQVDAAVQGLTSMIEPIVIAFLGVFIGGIVISLFLPIFKITELISH